MFNIGDYVQHQQTGQSGQVVGYGHNMVNYVYLPTLKVRLTRAQPHHENIIEDASSTWVAVTAEEAGVFPPQETDDDISSKL